MPDRLAIRRLLTIVTLLILPCCISGCMTTWLKEKVEEPQRTTAGILRVRGVSTRDQDLFLLLDLEKGRQTEERTILLKVPVGEIGANHETGQSAGLRRGNLALQPPAVGCYQHTTSLPEEGRSLPLTYLRHVKQWEMAAYMNAVPPGVHVLIVDFCHEYELCAPEASPPDGIVPLGAAVALVTRNAGEKAKAEYLRGFTETPERHLAWLLLAPLTVAGDILTAPLQLLAALIMPEC